MNKEKIKTIIDSYLHSSGPTSHMTTDECIAAAAATIAALPVDKVRAMAVLVKQMHNFEIGGRIYAVPSDDKLSHEVLHFGIDGAARCSCGVADCDHVRAVEMHLANQEECPKPLTIAAMAQTPTKLEKLRVDK